MTEIESRDGRTYFLNDDGKVEYITGTSGRAYPYTYDQKYNAWTNRSGCLSYKYLRRLENAGKLFFN